MCSTKNLIHKIAAYKLRNHLKFLLFQTIHADIRPDIFIPGTTKYTEDELKEMLKDDTKPVYVAADENDVCLGYAFFKMK